jgi:osmoprotectant transport system ATP-binding protein
VFDLVEVVKSFGPTCVLRGVSLTVERGQTTVLLGPSGCGKSTLIRLMIGLVWPDAGKVLFAGMPLTPANVLRLRHRMGYVVQDGGLFPHLTIARNVGLMARHLGWERERIEARLGELAELARLPTDVLRRYPAELSGGQRQRAGLMRALMLDPDVLLLDEPLGALDPITRADLQGDLRGVFRRLKKTVVLVTHDLAEAAYFGDRIVLLADGQIEQQGSMHDLADRPSSEFVTRFVRAQRAPLEAFREGKP